MLDTGAKIIRSNLAQQAIEQGPSGVQYNEGGRTAGEGVWVSSPKTVLNATRIDGVHGDLVLGTITDEVLGVGEGGVGRGGAVALVAGDDLDAVVLPDAETRVGGAEVDPDNSRVLALAGHPCLLPDGRTARQRGGGGSENRGEEGGCEWRMEKPVKPMSQ